MRNPYLIASCAEVWRASSKMASEKTLTENLEKLENLEMLENLENLETLEHAQVF